MFSFALSSGCLSVDRIIIFYLSRQVFDAFHEVFHFGMIFHVVDGVFRGEYSDVGEDFAEWFVLNVFEFLFGHERGREGITGGDGAVGFPD